MGLDVTGLGSLADFATTVVNKIWPDANEQQKAQAQQAILEATQTYNLQAMQVDVNKIEAASTNWFVAGWRPFIGWIGGTALAYASIIEPLARFIAAVGFHYTGAFPVIDTQITLQVLIGLLGFGVYRTYEKKNDVAR